MSHSDKLPDPDHDPSWGKPPPDNFGYASEQQRHNKRGLEDWEMVEKIPESQRNIPYWFGAVIFVVLLVAIGLSFPFWGDRPGYERAWVDWGFAAAIVYVALGIAFIYSMVNLYGSHRAGRLDTDKNKHDDEKNNSSSK